MRSKGKKWKVGKVGDSLEPETGKLERLPCPTFQIFLVRNATSQVLGIWKVGKMETLKLGDWKLVAPNRSP